MMREEYVQFDTAKLLKAAGFPQDIKQTLFYNKVGQDWHMADGYYGNGYAKPSQAQAMRWLREECSLFINMICNDAYGDSECGYNWQLVKMMPYMDKNFKLINFEDEVSAVIRDPEQECIDEGLNPYESRYSTYEEAAEAGIQAACEYLIKKR